MQPTLVGWLQVQPIDPVGLGSDVQSEVGREQVSILCDATFAAVDPLGERLFSRFPHRQVCDKAVVRGLYS